MILGAVAAISQKNIKRLLAYSSIGHIGYALAGVATGNISGYQSAIVYISIYVIMNIGIFSCLYLLKKEIPYLSAITDLPELRSDTPTKSISSISDSILVWCFPKLSPITPALKVPNVTSSTLPIQ